MLTEEDRKAARRLAAQDLARSELSRNPVADFGSGVNKTLIAVAGFPADLSNKLFNMVGAGFDKPTLGSDYLTEKAEDYGFINKGLPETGAERAGKIVGTALPGIGAVGGLAKATSMTAPILQGFRAAPKAFAATEFISAGGAAAGGEIGRSHGEWGQLIGEIIGGLAAPLTVATISKFPTFRLARRVLKPILNPKESGADVIQSSVEDKSLIVHLAENADLLEGNKLTLGGKAGSPRLLSIEKAVAKKLPEVADDMARNEAETNSAIYRAMKEQGGDIDNTVMYFESQRMRVENALRARMAAAVKKANTSVDKLKPGSSRAEASRIYSREMEDALSDARIQETQTWDNLDGTQQLLLSEARKYFDEFVTAETPIASFVRDAFKGKGIKVKSFKDVRELRSKILRVQRFARANGNAEEAFVLQQINKGILEDISNSNLGPDFANAVSYSRSLNEKFTRGEVGNLLRFSPRGGRAVSAELVSEDLLSTTPAKAAQGIRAVRESVKPIGVSNPAPNDALETGILDSIKNRLFRSTGEFDESAAMQFVNSKGELLDEVPGLKKQIVDAVGDINARNALKEKIATAKVGLVDRRRSASAVLLGADPKKRLTSILNHPRRKQMLAQIVRGAKKSPDAMEGLQDAYSTEMFRLSSTSRFDASGRKVLSGQAMRKFFNETKDDLINSGFYTKENIKNWNRIINTTEKLEKQILARPESAEIVMHGGGLGWMIEDLILRLVGANLGSNLASGAGGSFVMAAAGSRFVRMLVDKMPLETVTKVLGEAVKNPELMKDLMFRRTTFNAQKEGVKRLNAWISTLDPITPLEIDITKDSTDYQ